MVKTSTRRDFLRASVTGMGGLWMLSHSPLSVALDVDAASRVPLELPALPYGYDALEPYIDAETMRIHHDLHHAGYVKGLRAALDGLAETRAAGNYTAVQSLSRALAFHGGGHYNHSVFWQNMAPPAGRQPAPSAALREAIARDFSSIEVFQAHFGAAAKAVEGSGWAVLGWHGGLSRLVVLSLMNQQDLGILGTEPLLMLDVWEHAYYLKYQNRRAAYVDAWWNVVNWADVDRRFEAARSPQE